MTRGYGFRRHNGQSLKQGVQDNTQLQQFIDAMPDGIAVIARDGTVRHVNEAWRQFSRDNQGNTETFNVGENYLHTGANGTGETSGEGQAIRDGIAGVLEGDEEFRAEYTCSSPSKKRWFLVTARPMELDGERHALISHRNITRDKLSEIEATDIGQKAKNLAAIVATMPDAVIGFDLAGRITSWNAAAERLYGYDAAEVIGQSIEIIFPPDWPVPVGEYIRDIVENGRQNFEVIRRTREGRLRMIEVTAAPVKSVSGRIVGVSNVNRDVTDQRESERRLRNVLDNLFAFVGVLTPDGTLVEANRAPLEAAGLEAADVIGKKFWDCYWWNYSPDAQKQLQQACRRALAGEQVRYDVEVRVAGDELLWIDFQVAPLLGSDGEVINLIPSGIDISERKAAVDALRASHDTFRNLVEQSPFGIYTVDADFRLAHVSKGALPAFENVNPLIGRDFDEALHILWPEPFASDAIARFRHTLETGESYRSPATTERRRDIDEVESYDWMIERIVMPDGSPGVVCNFYDLSERQRHEEQIRLLMREVNHRSKNLLTVVMSMARQTQRSSSPDDFVEKFAQRLLGLSASQDLIVQSDWHGVTVRDLVTSQVKHLWDKADSQRVTLVGPDLLLTPAAAQGIGMAIHELATNAVKYGALSVPDGAVSIVWGTDAGNATFDMQWRERDGPVVVPPDRTGFGRTVTEKMAALSVGGTVSIDYPPSGLQWTLHAPLENVLVGAPAQSRETSA